MILFSLFLIAALLLLGGVSVDLMRHEFSRLRLQSVLDTAVLAAADLDQTLDPEAVVRDYFAKAGLGEDLVKVSVTESLNSRSVTATGTMSVPTIFVKALGIDNFDAGAGSEAREDITNIEVSLVLDVSGSMGNYGRLAAMKTAAKQFVAQVLTASPTLPGEPDQVSISIVPYSTQVAAGSAILDQLTLAHAHDYSACLDFADGDFDSTAIDPAHSYTQTGHFDPFTRSSPPTTPVCRTESAFTVQPLGNSLLSLDAQIDGLTAGGNTSIDVGVKWGAALLDPSLQPVVQSMVDAGRVNADFAGRPYAFTHENTMKVLVVMTDGENTAQYRLNDAFREQVSDVWGVKTTGFNGDSWRFSVDSEEPGDRDGDGRWREKWWQPRNNRWSNSIDGSASDAVRLSYQDLFAAASVEYNAYYNWYRQSYDNGLYNWWYNTPVSSVPAWKKNDRLAAVCQAAKDRGILIFAVGFEISPENAQIMRNCASSENHYFDVDGLEIVHAFAAIASSINQLRLVQ